MLKVSKRLRETAALGCPAAEQRQNAAEARRIPLCSPVSPVVKNLSHYGPTVTCSADGVCIRSR